jgi:biotin carboxylase
MKLLLFATTTGYQIREFEAAARRLGLDVRLATDRCHLLDDPWADRAIPVRFEDDAVPPAISRFAPDAIAAVGDRPAVKAALAAEACGVRFHPAEAARNAADKRRARDCFRRAGMLVPDYRTGAAPSFPCVVKATRLSGGRGVIRANDEAAFQAAVKRIRAIPGHGEIQAEAYVEGREYALEGLVSDGRLRVLALFDKPDPLTGPYFEETIYVTPSREREDIQRAIAETAQQAVSALGLTQGPVHAEMRVNGGGVWILEAAARPIGGLCARALRFNGGTPLEEVILRHALGETLPTLAVDGPAAGVMMIPVPGHGILDQVRGADDDPDIVITAKQGECLVPLPEGKSYPGFIFARGATPAAVESTLRAKHARLEFRLLAALPVV